MKKLALMIIMFPSLSLAWDIGIYDSETDKNKIIVVFSCGGKSSRLLMNRDDLETKYSDVESWTLDMKKTCKGEL